MGLLIIRLEKFDQIAWTHECRYVHQQEHLNVRMYTSIEIGMYLSMVTDSEIKAWLRGSALRTKKPECGTGHTHNMRQYSS